MTQQNAQLRQDQPIQIGSRHGYSIECDHASINAELEVPPHHSGGEWMLELWATDHTYQEGPLTGLRIAQVAVELPTPIGPYLHQVEARIPARLPPSGRAYSMVLALVRQDADGQRNVDAFANYAELQAFIAPHLAGQADYQVDGNEVVLTADGIVNPRIEGNESGTLSLELWAFPESDVSSEGQRLASAEMGSVSGQYWLQAVERRVAFSEPPVGRHRMAMLLCEWTGADGYVARDRRDLASIYERPAPAPVVAPAEPVVALAEPVVASSEPAVASPAPVASTAASDPAEKPRLVPTAVVASAASVAAAAAEPIAAPASATSVEPIAAPAPATSKVTVGKAAVASKVTVASKVSAATSAPAAAIAEPTPQAPAPTALGLVSIQTAGVDELAKVEGLNLKIAKAIIKARPFTSLADLVRVPGIGEKSLARLKRLLSL
jgi:DNA uptake protein ComE-like DNA-binding protein